MCNAICNDLNFLGILVSSLAYFALGSLWYSPVLFGTAWQKLVNISMKPGTSQLIKIFGLTFILILISAVVMDYFMLMFGISDFLPGLWIGLLCGIGFVLTTSGINALYQSKPLKLFLIDCGYHLLGFLILGGILGAWDK
jgi:hypothetical protein